MAGLAPQLDLLSWPIIQERAAAAARAEAELAEARRRFRVAPHGSVRARAEAMQKAATEALAAEVAYQRALLEARP